jgi:cobalt-zinc-cadmium resistance protein CzcA
MVRKLIEWAVNSPLIVILLAVALAVGGGFAFANVNVEAYPDPAPAIIEVVAQYPGASAEEVERQVTIPLEVTLAGMPGLKYTRSKSLFGLSHLRNQFDYGVDFYKARQEVINRLQFTSQLPPGVNPQISPMTPTGELLRYTVNSPKDALGREIYALRDLKAIQDWTLVREFRRVPRIIDVVSLGGSVKRYEVHPDPDRLKKYGITLKQVQNAISNSNGNVGGDLLTQGPTALNVRGIGLLGGGQDPMQPLPALTDFRAAASALRVGEERRLRQIRQIIITSVNNVPIRVEDVVEGGPNRSAEGDIFRQGVVIGQQTRLGKLGLSSPRTDDAGQVVRDAEGHTVWEDEEDKVQGVVLMRKGEETLKALEGAHEKLDQMNKPGRLLPGVQLQTYFDVTGLIHVTTETVRENLLVGMVLVTVILLMFLSNVRSALIVAVNIPLALLFAFSVLFLRGKSANLLSIGAVDFGIIVDSSVIMVENIYRHVSSGEYAELPLKERIIRASHEIERALFFSTAIMICAFIPLFTMQGPEGQIFGPMADTYAFALGGALLLALLLSPVLCLIFFRHLKPARDNFLVRWLKTSYLRQLDRCLRHRALTLAFFGFLTLGTLFLLFGVPALKKAYPEELAWAPALGREFMPELEEGNLYVRGTFPVNVSLEESADKARRARDIFKQYEEIQLVASQVGRPDDGTDPTGFYNIEFNIPLKPEKDWPLVKAEDGWRRWLLGHTRRTRTKPELIQEMNADLSRHLPGVDWNFSQYIRDNVMESLSGVKGDNSVKIIGPDLDELERLAERFKTALDGVPGIQNVGIFRIKGQPNLEFPVDREKCNAWGVSVADVENVIRTAVGGQAFTQMIEGEKIFDITLRWPQRLRDNEQAILNIPVDVSNNNVTAGNVPGTPQTPLTGQSSGVSATGTSLTMPSLTGTAVGSTLNNISNSPRRRLGDLVTPIDDAGNPDPSGSFLRPGASTIYREQGQRLIAVKFSVRDRDLAGAVAEAQEVTAPLLPPGYRTEWSGEFQEMQEAEHRLMFIIPLSLGLIFALLYFAFHSLFDVLAILSNVIALSLGGVWALLLTGTNFSISAAVGFISIFGVAIMDGLLLIAYFNQLRAHGLPLREAILQGAEKRVRPIMMTALTAIFGLLPAAVSTRIGAQTQRPLAIVVVGGMITVLFLTRYLMPVLYSFYGHREPPASAGGLAH